MNDRESLNPEKYILVVSATDSLEEAEKLADELITEKIAACVSISSPVQSIYRWQDKIEREQEFMLFIKTAAACYQRVESLIQRRHSYDLPEIMAIPVTCLEIYYGQWIDKNTLGT